MLRVDDRRQPANILCQQRLLPGHGPHRWIPLCLCQQQDRINYCAYLYTHGKNGTKELFFFFCCRNQTSPLHDGLEEKKAARTVNAGHHSQSRSFHQSQVVPAPSPTPTPPIEPNPPNATIHELLPTHQSSPTSETQQLPFCPLDARARPLFFLSTRHIRTQTINTARVEMIPLRNKMQAN